MWNSNLARLPLSYPLRYNKGKLSKLKSEYLYLSIFDIESLYFTIFTLYLCTNDQMLQLKENKVEKKKGLQV